MIFTLLLTLSLDMSLPEFTPQEDLSGNYIVSDYDVSAGEAFTRSISSDELAEVGLSPSAEARSVDTSSNDSALLDELSDFHSDNNAYWEQFLADYESNYFKKNVATVSSPAKFWIGSSGSISTSVVNTYKFAYCEVIKGHTYTINGLYFPVLASGASFRSGFVADINNPGSSVVSFHNFYSQDPNGYTFTAPMNGFYVLCVNSGDNNVRGFNLIETLTYREDITEIRNEMNMKFRVLIFLTLISFTYPIVVSISKNIVGGKS